MFSFQTWISYLLICATIATAVLEGNSHEANLPWFHDADGYWDMDEVTADSRVMNSQQPSQASYIVGEYLIVPGQKGNALELKEKPASFVKMAKYRDKCLAEPSTCESGFTITFWVYLATVAKDGVILQFAMTRGSRGITINAIRKESKFEITVTVNTAKKIRRTTISLRIDLWYHLSVVWQMPEETVSVFVNCTRTTSRVKVKDSSSRKGVASTLFLGANHAGKKSMKIIVDEFAIWFRSLEEDRLCQIVRENKVHGNHTAWSEFSSCSTSCGEGTKTRERYCENPRPDYGGRDCSTLGPPRDTQPCGISNPCAVAGGYSEWSNFSACTLSCGGGKRYRNRTCSNPMPMHGGSNCSRLGEPLDVQDCNTHPCPIHGNYTPWEPFGPCSVSCGDGVQQRNRSCMNPRPEFGGRDCSGPSQELRRCNQGSCPVHGAYGEWSNFSTCSQTCGNATRVRTRSCTDPEPKYGGNNCTGPSIDRVPCLENPPCPIHGNYSDWSIFSSCDRTCGNGSRVRWRNCSNPQPRFGGRNCTTLGPGTDTVLCNAFPCPIHGNFTSWSRFTRCSKTCGNGTRVRTRLCTNPRAQHGGNDCSMLGPNIHVVSCKLSPCPVHGNFSQWSRFTECSATCGNSTKTRTRNCTNPVPMHGGKNCSSLGPEYQEVPCVLDPCPIHGNFSQWSSFTECSATCGNSTKMRTRNCTNPVPMHGGNDCAILGSNFEVAPCVVSRCPIHGNYTEWSKFSACSATCGDGSQSRRRTCTNPAPRFGGRSCTRLGSDHQIRFCFVGHCPIHGNYNKWSEFSECTKSCASGSKTRYRSCRNPEPQYGGRNCSNLGNRVEVRVCNTHPCPIHGNYSDWSEFSECTKSCASGSKTRYRSCTRPKPEYGGRNCSSLGDPVEVKVCNAHPCPIHGIYSEWSEFRPCTKSCASGNKTRYRSCTNPNPEYGGRNCSSLGDPVEVKVCNAHPCPIHGNYSKWSEFSECTKSCASGNMTRYRSCTNPEPKYGGQNCSSLGDPLEVMVCNTHPCPIHGNYSEWSEFSECTKSCASGNMTRYRSCGNPEPKYGGRNCSSLGDPVEVMVCNTHPCPIDGNYSDWSEFSECTRSCASGNMSRYRFCTNPEPKYGGRTCSRLGDSVEVRVCNTHPCPIDGSYSEWSQFGPCSKTCENGTQLRQRTCSEPPPRYGGRNCSRLGEAVEMRRCETQECPDIDLLIKFEVDGVAWDEDFDNKSSRKFEALSSKLTTALFELHGENVVRKVNVLGFSQGSVVAEIEVVYFSRNFPGAGFLHDALFFDNKIASVYVTPLNLSSTDVPITAPLNLTAFNRSSTSLDLYWGSVPSWASNGPLLGYEVSYQQQPGITGNDIQPAHHHRFGNGSSGILKNLKKYSWYRIRISAFNRRGVGVPSSAIVVLTDEDVPNSSPNLKPFGQNTSSTSLEVSWRAIEQRDVNGVLRGYCVFYIPPGHSVVKNETTSPDVLTVALTGLEKYTGYRVWVAGITAKGVGVGSPKTVIHTGEDLPEAAPEFFSCRNDSSTSVLLKWREIPRNERNGRILRYRVYYKQSKKAQGKWTTIDGINGAQTSYIVRNLTWFTRYSFRIAAFTSKGEGVVSENITVSTDEDVPCAAPSEISAVNSSSTSLWLDWRHLTAKCTRGILTSYLVFYKQQGQSQFNIIRVDPTKTELNITGLRKFTVYNVSLAGVTSKGHGPLAHFISISTAEDIPSKSPISLMAFNTSSTSIKITWEAIPSDGVHGVLLGYHVIVRRANEMKSHKYTVLPTEHSFEVRGLLKYTKYVVKLVGFTSPGIGVVSDGVVVYTDQDTPGRMPEKLEVINHWSPTSIPLAWKPIGDKYYVHGILLGYKIEVQLIKVAGEPLSYISNKTLHIVGPTERSYEVTHLEIYATYKIRLWAFTIKGGGAVSEEIAETCRCRSSLNTNWWINPPYIYRNSTRPEGIIPLIIPDVVTSCCGYCHAHDTTRTQFESRDPTVKFYKSGVSEFRDHIDNSVDLHFPVYGQMQQEKYARRYDFIPLVESPGVVFLVLEDEEGLASKILLRTLFSTLPIFILMLILVVLFSLLIWFTDGIYNPTQFPPDSILWGLYEGIWWSFISMTTIGYGDRCPRSVPGRLIGMLWILIGAVLMGFYTSVITWDLTKEIVVTDVKLYGTKVAVIYESAEHRLAVRKNAKLEPDHLYHNLYEIYQALSERRTDGALIDAYVLGSRRDLFNTIGIRINNIYDYSSAYGVVLAGEARKLSKCFRKYIKENRGDVFKIIEDNVDMIEEDEISQSVRRAESLIDSTSPVFRHCLLISGISLIVAFVFGCLYECLRKPLKKYLFHFSKFSSCYLAKLNVARKDADKLLLLEINASLLKITTTLKALKRKHYEEIKHWIKLREEYELERRRDMERTLVSGSFRKYHDHVDDTPSVVELKKLIVQTNSRTKIYEYHPNNYETSVYDATKTINEMY